MNLVRICHQLQKKELDSDEEIILDQNILADGKDYFAVGGWSVSPNNEWLAYSTDYVSRRIYGAF